jgi:hypothetical protein
MSVKIFLSSEMHQPDYSSVIIDHDEAGTHRHQCAAICDVSIMQVPVTRLDGEKVLKLVQPERSPRVNKIRQDTKCIL